MKIRPKWNPEKYQYDRFAVELAEWSESGKIPALADQDSGYYLSLQKERLEKKNLKMKLALEKCEEDDAPGVVSYPGRHYENRMEFASVRRSVEYSRNGRRLYRRKNDQVLYQMITRADTPEEIGEKPYSCPNCGAVTRVIELTRGCPYCNSRFLMSELFPRVTNYYYIRMDSMETRKKKLNLIIGSCIGFSFLFMLFHGGAAGELTPGVMISALFVAMIAGYFLGSVLTLLLTFLTAILFYASISVPLWAVFTKKKVQRFMERIDPNFPYKYFEGQIMSLLRMVVLSGDVKNLAAFDGSERSDCFDNIIDMVYEGGMTVRRLRQDSSLCAMELRTYMLDTYEEGGRVYTRSDSIDITVVRSRDARISPGFSIKLVKCRSCGGSFDASRQKKCPHCGTEYEMKKESWVLTRAVRVS